MTLILSQVLRFLFCYNFGEHLLVLKTTELGMKLQEIVAKENFSIDKVNVGKPKLHPVESQARGGCVKVSSLPKCLVINSLARQAVLWLDSHLRVRKNSRSRQDSQQAIHFIFLH